VRLVDPADTICLFLAPELTTARQQVEWVAQRSPSYAPTQAGHEQQSVRALTLREHALIWINENDALQ
jgi:hypothetical protein